MSVHFYTGTHSSDQHTVRDQSQSFKRGWGYCKNLIAIAQCFGFCVTCGVNMMSLRRVWGWQPPQTASHILITHIQNVWVHWYAVHWHTVTALHNYTHPTWLISGSEAWGAHSNGKGTAQRRLSLCWHSISLAWGHSRRTCILLHKLSKWRHRKESTSKLS